MRAELLGICIGGRGRRMGGVQKALLPAPASARPLIARTLEVARAAGLADVVLLGAAELGEHAHDVPQLPDAMPEQGPLVALSSLLHYAGDRPALCLACDMPFITPALLERVAKERPEAVVLAPRDPATHKWQALFARYASRVVLPVLTAALAEGERSFQGLFQRLAVQELLLDPSEHAQLRDWDTPEDMQR